jgi:hypothetical protein
LGFFVCAFLFLFYFYFLCFVFLFVSVFTYQKAVAQRKTAFYACF